jgi:tetraacyldisaccharide 4'-kinase
MWRAWVEGVIFCQNRGFCPSVYKIMMSAPSLVYKLILTWRHALYDRGWIKVSDLPVPVISVGNIACGGMGKTPVVAKLAQMWQEKGYKVGILSRGYKGRYTHPQVVDIHKITACECGDEPWMLARQFPQAVVVVGKNRYQAGLLAIEQGAQVIVLDDGLQHRKLARDVEIVVVDGMHPTGYGQFLPKGPLRDLPERLDRADIIVTVGAPLQEAWPVKRAHMTLNVQGLFDDKGLVQLSPKKVGIFCAIGRPYRFVQSVKNQNMQVVAQTFLGDHENIKESQLKAFSKKCQQAGATAIICTEKDWVKKPIGSVLPVYYLKVKLDVEEGLADWQNVIFRECV